MRNKITVALCLLAALVAASSCAAAAQTDPVVEHQTAQPELALTYTYIRSNAHPGGCGCFSLNGGSASFAWPIKTGRFDIVGDVTAATAAKVLNSHADLTLSSYTVGMRYNPHLGSSPWSPFGQVLAGVAHSSGSFVQGQSSATTNANAAFAARMGGGLDRRVSRHFSLRLLETSYLITTFNNSVNNHQNSLDANAGIVLRFGGK